VFEEPKGEAITPATAQAPGAKAHVPALDGVRGIAILLVIFYHFASSLEVLGVTSPLFAPFAFGWCGVDVFFALSGFLITGILLDTKASPNYFKAFYARRILRIFPLYYGALAVTFLLRAAFPDAGIWGSHSGLWAPGSFVWPALFLQNAAIFIRGADATGVMAHYWSLAVEEHFYLVWPLLIWLLSRRWAMIVAMLAIAISIVARAVLLHRGMDTDPIFGLTPLRMDGLAVGALAAMLIRSHDIHRMMRPAALTLVGAATVLIGIFLIRGTTDQSDPAIWIASYPLVSVCTAATLILSCSGGWLARLLSASVLRWFGKYSYGLYVWHPIVGMLLFHSRLSPVPSDASPALIITITLCVFALDLLVAWASFQLWEKRFLDLKRYFPAHARPVKPVWKPAALTPAPGP
jgi:peptidoglycan/LPS O-acetylase OafA/YrhL